ncbi:MAG: DUF2007 domain-containing protein [Dehalococcoidia bacterium]|nr:DUF2007 domain-containing protein [Dehalococcoidia bacterium]
MTKNEATRINWVSVYSAKWDVEAEIVRSRLETEDVPAVLRGGTGSYGAWSLGPRIMTGTRGWCDVMVPEDRAAEAKKILNTKVDIMDFGAE